jgi:hypothetical protein
MAAFWNGGDPYSAARKPKESRNRISIEEVNGEKRVLDITHTPSEVAGVASITTDDHLKKVSKGVTVEASDTCFVMMPFAAPLDGYYASIYEPAIKKAGRASAVLITPATVWSSEWARPL